MKGLIFTFALSYGGAFVALLTPFVGLLIYVSFAILRPEQLWWWSVPQGGYYSRVVAIGLLAGWVIHGFGRWQFGRARVIVAALVTLLVWSALSAATIAPNKELAWRFVESLAKIVLPFVVGITILDSLKKVKALAWVIVLSEGYVAFDCNFWYFSGYNKLWFEGFGGMDNNCNAIALVTCIGLGVILGFAAERWWQKALAFGLCVLMIHAVLFSFSRGGMLALIVTGAVTFYLMPKRPINYAVALIGFIVVLRLAGPQVVERFETVFASSGNRDTSAESRLILWGACIDTMWKNPLGVGAGNWGEVVAQYGFNRGKLAHTVWLQLGAELGLIGFASIVLFYGQCILRLWPLTYESAVVSDPWFRHLARMVIASLAGFAVSAQFVSLDLLEQPYYVALIGAGALKLHSAAQAQKWAPSQHRGAYGAVPARPVVGMQRSAIV